MKCDGIEISFFLLDCDPEFLGGGYTVDAEGYADVAGGYAGWNDHI